MPRSINDGGLRPASSFRPKTCQLGGAAESAMLDPVLPHARTRSRAAPVLNALSVPLLSPDNMR
jgi:hypothetical protein